MLHIKFQNLSKILVEEEDFDFFYFYGLNIGHLVQGHLGPRGLHLNKLGKGPLCNAT